LIISTIDTIYSYFSFSIHRNTRSVRRSSSPGQNAILNNKKEETAAYFTGLKCISQWPQFNRFTVGYAFSKLPPENKNFQQGLKWQYESMDDCACEAPDISKLSDLQKTELIKTSKTARVRRACWNTWIAPHNLEGFFLNFGDMLVKNGEWQKAIDIYSLAKVYDTYDKWLYRDTLEQPIQDAKENVGLFNKPVNEPALKNQRVIMSNSGFSCMGRHGMSHTELVSFGKSQPPLSYYYFLNEPKK
jgi:hypothetical protein